MLQLASALRFTTLNLYLLSRHRVLPSYVCGVPSVLSVVVTQLTKRAFPPHHAFDKSMTQKVTP